MCKQQLLPNQENLDHSSLQSNKEAEAKSGSIKITKLLYESIDNNFFSQLGFDVAVFN